jgi:hypothetical protein
MGPHPAPCRRREGLTGDAHIWRQRATRAGSELRCWQMTAMTGGARTKVHGAATGRRTDSSPVALGTGEQRWHWQRVVVGQWVWRKEQVAGTGIERVDISLFSEDSRAHGPLSFLATNEGSNVQNLMPFLATNGGSNVQIFFC